MFTTRVVGFERLPWQCRVSSASVGDPFEAHKFLVLASCGWLAETIFSLKTRGFSPMHWPSVCAHTSARGKLNANG